MESIGQVLKYIDDLLPNSLDTPTKISIINSELRKIWKPMTKDEIYSFVTVADTPIYSLPTNVKIDMVKGVYVSNSTAAASSTTYYEPYEYAGEEEEPEGHHFYNVSEGIIGIYPTPEKEYPGRIVYQEYPVLFGSTDTSALLNIDQDYIDIVKFRTMSRIAKSGRYPNVILANNYESDAKELERKMKIKLANDKANRPQATWSYKEGW